MTRFFTADLHLGHVNIIRYADRPFDDVAEMNAVIIDRWNSTVTPDDEVFILGDLAMGHLADTLPLVQQLNGYIFLLPGNHDRCWPGHGDKANDWTERYLDAGVDQIVQPHTVSLGRDPRGEGTASIDDQIMVRVHHFPYLGSDPEDEARRYTEHRPTDNGRWLLHGHVHEKWVAKDRMINVGVDQWEFKPVPADALITLISSLDAALTS